MRRKSMFPRRALLMTGTVSAVGLCTLFLMLSMATLGFHAFARQSKSNIVTPITSHNFTPISATHTSADYLNVVEQTFLDAEGVKSQVYDDGRGIPTIGIGYNLKVRPVLNIVVASFGADPTKLSTQQQKAVLTTYIDKMAAKINAFSKGNSITTLQGALATILGNIRADAALPLTFRNGVQQNFAFKTPIAANMLFSTIYNDLSFETTLNSSLGGNNLNDSLERVTLISLVYNGLSLHNSQIVSDIASNSRAKVWYDIRYATDANNNSKLSADHSLAKGVAIRRDYESDLFGLYNGDPFSTSSVVTNDEANQIFAVILANEGTIYQSVIPVTGKPPFNNQYYFDPDTLVKNGNNNAIIKFHDAISAVDGATTLATPEADFTVRTLSDDLAPAANYLLTNPAAIGSGNILVYNQPGSSALSTINLLQKDATTPVAAFLQNDNSTNQQIILNNKSDLLYSKENSTILLGAGVDQLTLQGTTSTVDATQLQQTTNLPIDTITFGGHSIAGTIPATGSYNGEQYTLSGTTLTITSGNSSLTILGFHTGDFGVTITPTQCTPNATGKTGSTFLSDAQSQNQCPPPPTAKVIFGGMDAQGHYNLWVTDGTSSGTRELANVPGENSYYGLFPGGVTSLGSKVVFNGYDIHNQQQLWVSDGTVAGTMPLTSINNSLGDGLNPQNFVVLNGKAVFNGYDANGNEGVWSTDGTTGGTIELSTSGGGMKVFGQKVLFAEGYTIWSTDGTLAGTQKLANNLFINLSDFTVFGSEALFTAQNDVFGTVGLWITDGTVAGTHPVQQINQPGFAQIPFDITVVGSKAFFQAVDASGHYELWVSDGTAAGTQELTTVTNGYASLFPSNITALGNRAVFSGYDTNGNLALWASDGTTGGTTELVASNLAPTNFNALGKQVLFTTANTGNSMLWVTDGTSAGTHKIVDQTNGFYGFGNRFPIVLGNDMLFNGKSDVTDEELWITNGTTAGTVALTAFTTSDLTPYNFALLN